jgi:hypothetical protein
MSVVVQGAAHDCSVALTLRQGWVAATLLNSWVAYGGANQAPQYTLVGGLVMLRGSMKNGTYSDGTTLLTLPEGYRPPAAIGFIVWNDVAQCNISVSAAGSVKIYDASGNGIVTLDGILFSTES